MKNIIMNLVSANLYEQVGLWCIVGGISLFVLSFVIGLVIGRILAHRRYISREISRDIQLNADFEKRLQFNEQLNNIDKHFDASMAYQDGYHNGYVDCQKYNDTGIWNYDAYDERNENWTEWNLDWCASEEKD